MLTRRMMVLASVSMLVACGAGGAGRTVGLAPNSRLIVYRHGDRDDDLLNARGHRRAEAFVMALDGVPIDAIYTVNIERNLQTAAPLARARGLQVQTLAPTRLPERLARHARGRSVVWIGNLINLRNIWAGLDLPDDPPVNYGELVILTMTASGELQTERRMVSPLAI